MSIVLVCQNFFALHKRYKALDYLLLPSSTHLSSEIYTKDASVSPQTLKMRHTAQMLISPHCHVSPNGQGGSGPRICSKLSSQRCVYLLPETLLEAHSHLYHCPRSGHEPATRLLQAVERSASGCDTWTRAVGRTLIKGLGTGMLRYL